MNRRFTSSLLITLWSVVVSLLLYGRTFAQATSRPNVVVIVSDDQGWGDFSMSGNPVVKTPHLDTLAQNGARFDQFFVHAVCSPTRASLLTGRYAVRGGVYSTSAGGERLDLDETTFADCFQRAGYRTAAFGKWHNGAQYPYHPNGRGFEEFYGYCSGHWGSYFDAMLDHNGAWVQSRGYLTDVLTERAMNYIHAQKDTNFLVYLALNTPHSPMQVPDYWWDQYAVADLPSHPHSSLEDSIHTRAAYAMCANIDWNVGRVVAQIQSLDLLDHTLIVYLSDNGPNGWRWNGGMEGIKGYVADGGLRTPLIMHWPAGIPASIHPDGLAGDIDLFPTLLDIAGIVDSQHLPLDGKSLVPLLASDSSNWPDRYLVNYWKGKTSVRSQHARLTHDGKLIQTSVFPQQVPTQDITASNPEALRQHQQVKQDWEAQVLVELPAIDSRTFPVGHPSALYTHLPARDAEATGEIRRSNRWPNCSYYTNWTQVEDVIQWEVDVLAPGQFEAILYYTCSPENVGATIELSMGNQRLAKRIMKAHSPPLRGMEHDRTPRDESYVKEFAPLSLGTITLEAGKHLLGLRALDIPGKEVADVRLLILKRTSF